MKSEITTWKVPLKMGTHQWVSSSSLKGETEGFILGD